ncbi:glycoside hydrolase family 47 protein [Ramaria rubella]|nr:glycoside hydrolase family 47 protein [Ramaria rubella]
MGFYIIDFTDISSLIKWYRFKNMKLSKSAQKHVAKAAQISQSLPQLVFPLAVSNIAEAGSLTMEWGTLSKYTGNDTFRTLAEGLVRHMAQLMPPLPGFATQGIDPSTGEFVADPLFIQTWQTAVDPLIKFLLKESTVGDWTYLADMEDDWQICHIGSHLACFHGGNWILGGQLLKNQMIVDIGLKIVDACFNTYASTAYIGPEVFGFISKINRHPPNRTDDGSFTKDPITLADIAFNNEHGFYIFDGGSDYILRPEVLELNFYSTIDSYVKFLIVPGGKGGVSGLLDVNNATVMPENHVDETECFMFAELFDFDDPEHISLDEYVFNTECHPLKAPPLVRPFGSKPTSTQLAQLHGVVCVLTTQARRTEAGGTSSTRS